MIESRTYRRNERGAWVPADEQESIAGEMTNPSTRIWFGVRGWTVSESSSYQRDTGDEFAMDIGESYSRRLRLELDTSMRAFHTIREEGIDPVADGFNLDVYVPKDPDAEIGGRVRHFGPGRRDDERNEIIGTVAVREEVMSRLIVALKSDERVSIGLAFKVYKPAIAQSFDENWMYQKFYVDHDQAITLDFFGYQITEERSVAVPVGGSDEEPVPVAATTPTLTSPTDQIVVQRLNWIVGALAIVIVVLLLKR